MGFHKTRILTVVIVTNSSSFSSWHSILQRRYSVGRGDGRADLWQRPQTTMEKGRHTKQQKAMERWHCSIYI